jgi:hypothetical protein
LRQTVVKRDGFQFRLNFQRVVEIGEKIKLYRLFELLSGFIGILFHEIIILQNSQNEK